MSCLSTSSARQFTLITQKRQMHQNREPPTPDTILPNLVHLTNCNMFPFSERLSLNYDLPPRVIKTKIRRTSSFIVSTQTHYLWIDRWTKTPIIPSKIYLFVLKKLQCLMAIKLILRSVDLWRGSIDHLTCFFFV